MHSKPMQLALSVMQSEVEAFDDPEDDFMATVVFETKDRGLAYLPVGDFIQSDQMKDALTEVVLPRLIEEFHVERIVLALSAWAVQVERDYETNDEPRPAQHPDRFEILMLTEMTAEGIVAEQVAYIDRDPMMQRPPKLGEWEDKFMPNATMSGRFVDPIVEALKKEKGES